MGGGSAQLLQDHNQLASSQELHLEEVYYSILAYNICKLMATLPRSFSSGEHSAHSVVGGSNGTTRAAAAAAKAKVKKSKKLSWTLGRKKSRDEAFVADGSGKLVQFAAAVVSYD